MEIKGKVTEEFFTIVVDGKPLGKKIGDRFYENNYNTTKEVEEAISDAFYEGAQRAYAVKHTIINFERGENK